MSSLSVNNERDRSNPAPQPAVGAESSTTTGHWRSSSRSAVDGFIHWFKGIRGTPSKKSQKLGWSAASFILLQVLLSVPLLSYAILRWHSDSNLRFACFLLVALAASLLKIRLPEIEATMSVNFVFILVGILDFSYPETLLMGCLGGLAQSLWHAKSRPRFIQVLFNSANLVISITAADLVFHSRFAYQHGLRWPFLLAAASTTYFAMNTMSISGIIAITERRNLLRVWKECYFWSFPYYMLGALLAGGVSIISRNLGWQVAIIVLPILYWIYRAYETYLDRLAAETKAAQDALQEVAALHLRTIEVLSLAIEAKDGTTHDHLKRVQVYAVELGKDLGLSDEELKAIRAAAILHDIGKLAIPEHILSKPGRLTPEEFSKMKTHVNVGVQILERVQFSYAVVPIVRCHHERWDGKGYPNSIQGEEIPIGARILSVVDCFDALASDRPYRKALPLDEALEYVKKEAGRSYDPRVVECLARRYHELEALVTTADTHSTRLEAPITMNPSVAPAAGYAEENDPPSSTSLQFLASIAGARQEAQLLFEVSKLLGNCLSLRETLSVVSVRLKEMIPHDSIVVHAVQGQELVPEYVHGAAYAQFIADSVPLGQGLTGWVALNQKPILNCNLSGETAGPGASQWSDELQSALSVPLFGKEGVAGVLTLYSREKNAFTTDHLRMLLATSSTLGLSVENAVRFEKAENSASMDFLTGLANPRALFSTLERELARCKRKGTSLGVSVCDLNGFKQVNDMYGHMVGNKLLQEVASNLVKMFREEDTIGRLGGDEFVFILPEFSPDDISQVEARLHSMIRAAAKKTCSESSISVSVGFAIYPEDGLDADRLISEADHRMYQQKKRHYSELAKVSASASPGPSIRQSPVRREEFPVEEVIPSANGR